MQEFIKNLTGNPLAVAGAMIVAYVLFSSISGRVKTWQAQREKQQAESLEAQRDRTRALNALIETLTDLAAERQEARERDREIMQTVLSAVETLAASGAKASEIQEKMLDGATKACLAIATTTDKHRTTVAEFAKMVFGPAGGRDALQVPSEGQRDKTYAELAFIAQGKTPEEAEALAGVEGDRASSYPSE